MNSNELMFQVSMFAFNILMICIPYTIWILHDSLILIATAMLYIQKTIEDKFNTLRSILCYMAAYIAIISVFTMLKIYKIIPVDIDLDTSIIRNFFITTSIIFCTIAVIKFVILGEQSLKSNVKNECRHPLNVLVVIIFPGILDFVFYWIDKVALLFMDKWYEIATLAYETNNLAYIMIHILFATICLTAAERTVKLTKSLKERS